MKKLFNFNKKQKIIFRIILVIISVIIVGILTYLIIFILNTDKTLGVNVLYELPEFESLEDLEKLDYGSYAVAIDGEVAFSWNDGEMHPTASTAKMILGLAIMQKKPFDIGEEGEEIEISQEYYDKYVWYRNNGGSVSEVYVGEKISQYDALASVFMISSNNMADAMAIWAFGSIDNYREYARLMLEEWGINDIVIGDDASGFSESTTATAKALARIGEKVKLNPVLSEIVNKKEYDLPVVGVVQNTNKALDKNKVDGIKTGYIGDPSGYCLVSSYTEDGHIITLALLGSPSRSESFNDSLRIITQLQNKLKIRKIISAGDTVAFYDSWWTGKVKITANEDVYALGWANANKSIELGMNGDDNFLYITIGSHKYSVGLTHDEYNEQPNLMEKIGHAFGWSNDTDLGEQIRQNEGTGSLDETLFEAETVELETEEVPEPITNAPSENCTVNFGSLMLINPNFSVDNDFIRQRRAELVSISELYGIVEGNPYNGDNLLDPEAATHINDMIKAYEADYPGHTMETRSCFRSVGTKCGRLCAATGESDHHTGLTCDLLDPSYGTALDTDHYDRHIDWQWLKANSYKYGFIDRFPEAWAGGSMSEPINVDENGSTGLFETWHYRYVGITAATEIATGKYNNGEYDSLEHYLKARGLINNLRSGTCE